MIIALTPDSMSDAEIVVSFTVARGAAEGSPFATDEGKTTAGAGVATGFAGAGRDVAAGRGVWATTTMNNKAAVNAARVILVKLIRAIFLLVAQSSPAPSQPLPRDNK
jgi:hypothetical protein